jgi:hypothetical protein
MTIQVPSKDFRLQNTTPFFHLSFEQSAIQHVNEQSIRREQQSDARAEMKEKADGQAQPLAGNQPSASKEAGHFIQ